MSHKLFSTYNCKWSFLNALGTLAYIILLATFMYRAKYMFSNVPEFMAPIVMLLLFVVSASVTGSLVLGRPVLMYLDGKKKEAIVLFVSTVGWLFGFLAVVLLVGTIMS